MARKYPPQRIGPLKLWQYHPAGRYEYTDEEGILDDQGLDEEEEGAWEMAQGLLRRTKEAWYEGSGDNSVSVEIWQDRKTGKWAFDYTQQNGPERGWTNIERGRFKSADAALKAAGSYLEKSRRRNPSRKRNAGKVEVNRRLPSPRFVAAVEANEDYDWMPEYSTVGYAWTASLDGKDVGVLTADKLGYFIHIEDVFVLPSARKEGVSKRLTDAVVSQLASTGLPLTLVPAATHREDQIRSLLSRGWQVLTPKMAQALGHTDALDSPEVLRLVRFPDPALQPHDARSRRKRGEP